jgi:outer membrane protein TolC
LLRARLQALDSKYACALAQLSLLAASGNDFGGVKA